MDYEYTPQVLYLESNMERASRVITMLRTSEVETEIAKTAREGLQKYSSGDYDVLMVNQTLPGQSGLDVIRILASQGTLPQVILMIEPGQEQVAVEALKLGVRDIISIDKDFRFMDVLPAVLDGALRQQLVERERQKAVEELRESETKHRLFLSSTRSPVLAIQEDMSILYCNDAYAEFVGIASDQLEGSPFESVPETYRCEQLMQTVLNVFETGKKHEVEWESSNFFYLTYMHLTPYGVLTFTEDITQRKEAEACRQAFVSKIEKLHTIARQLMETEFVEDVYALTADFSTRILESSIAIFWVAINDKLSARATSYGVSRKLTRSIQQDIGLAGRCYQSGKSILVRDPKDWGGPDVMQSEFKSAISIPIPDTGVFQVFSSSEGAFQQDDLRIIDLLLGYTTGALKRIHLQNEFIRQAIYDPQTGLYNRNYLYPALKREVKRADRHKYPILFMMIDVNQLREINDKHSYLVGDELLKTISTLMLRAVRETDIVVRYGGDEFLFILPDTANGAESVTKRLINDLEEYSRTSDLLDEPFSLAVGSASWNPEGDESVEDVINRADRSMYEMKKVRFK